MSLESRYDPGALQAKWYERWERSGYFAPSGSGEPYCIVLPPPNVTGSLHMGHGFQVTLMDVLIRHQRMRGRNVLWQAGTDHAGISTQVVVERLLQQEGLSRRDVGREAFIERVWEWKRESGDSITRQLRRLGASLDWGAERFTMDETISRAVVEVFVRLYRDGLIYRGARLVNWDAELGSAISDLEVNSVEEQGTLWHIAYPVEGSDERVVVATTRPETMLGDVAVAVHPDDSRYRHLIGAHLHLPLCDRLIPVIADDYVDPEFGSGCVKITPAHDFNDYAIGERHGLEHISVIGLDGRMGLDAPERFAGLEVSEARARVLEALRSEGALVREEPHTLKVPRSDRTGVVVEPLLTTQWHVAIGPLAERAIRTVETGDVSFVPRGWENTYFAWMRDIRDWCISRQLWWGHRIPAWYDGSGEVYVGRSEAEVRSHYGLDGDVDLHQDEDVLDTWFSSGLWSFATQGWPDDTERLGSFAPSSVLVTGFDIIFFWVARMIMLTLYCTDDVPFRQVYIHGLIRDAQGRKMSKSKGNTLDPIDLIDGIDLEQLIAKRTQGTLLSEHARSIERETREQFPEGIVGSGVDALRFTYCSLASTGRDINFDPKRLEGYRNFCTKLWNAARYVERATEGIAFSPDAPRSSIDRWILSQLRRTEAAALRALAEYRFDLAAQEIYDFVWNHYCDWYLELSKVALSGDDEQVRSAAAYTLNAVLEAVLRLAHPIIPFITEELWQQVAPRLGVKTVESIMLAPYPSADAAHLDADAEREMEWLRTVIGAVRNIRSELNISYAKPIRLLLQAPEGSDLRERVARFSGFIETLTRTERIDWTSGGAELPPSAQQVIGDLHVRVPLAGLVDVQAERRRLRKRLDQLDGRIRSLQGRLDSDSFRSKAPPDLVAETEAQSVAVQAEREAVSENLRNLERLDEAGP
ncbi:MAG: valine--tRNA ligase [Gammaproteobacteria bacterium AqS3]|nr:valine--tRNA ligase [Gammaproteobacteria bacterium AqS3]